jgi:hypothetical protein
MCRFDGGTKRQIKMAFDDVVRAKELTKGNHPELNKISHQIIECAVRFKSHASEEIKKGQDVVALYFLDRAIEIYPVDMQLYWQR